jgi:hypothetical protein
LSMSRSPETNIGILWVQSLFGQHACGGRPEVSYPCSRTESLLSCSHGPSAYVSSLEMVCPLGHVVLSWSRSRIPGRLVVLMAMVCIVACWIMCSFGAPGCPCCWRQTWAHCSRSATESGPSATQRKPCFQGSPLAPIWPAWVLWDLSGSSLSVCIHSVCAVDKECVTWR